MTAQMMDGCLYDGQEWVIANRRGTWPVPTSKALGFETRMASTANWSGRVDEFSVDDEGVLRLTSMQVCLTPDTQDVTPSGAHREARVGPAGNELRFVFDDLRIPFTGTLTLARDLNEKYYVHAGTQRANRFRHRAALRFDKGRLVESKRQEGSAPDMATPGWWLRLGLILGPLLLWWWLRASGCE